MDNLEDQPLCDAQEAGVPGLDPSVGAPIPEAEWEWFGGPGHFIAAFWCHWHLCTRVGEWLVSTVGEYLPSEHIWEIMARSVPGAWEQIAPLQGELRQAKYLELVGYEPLGAWIPGLGDGEKPLYETMVFWLGEGEPKRCQREDCGCGRLEVADWGGVWCERTGTGEKARRLHLEVCRKAARGEFKHVDELSEEGGEDAGE